MLSEERETKTAVSRVVVSEVFSFLKPLLSQSELYGRRKCLVGIQSAEQKRLILRKEVIQPQVPLRLPCYDFTPVADPTVVDCLPCGLAHRLRVKPTPMV